MSKYTYEEYIKNECHPVGYNEACESYYFAQSTVDNLLDQIRSLEEQLKNALKTKYKIGDTVYVNMVDYYGGKKHPVEQEIVGIEYHYNLKNYPYLDPTENMLFATREEAENRLAELEGK